MWYRMLKRGIELASVIFSEMEEEEKKKKKKLIEIGMDMWEAVDPTPDFDLDDEIVEIILYHLVDEALETVEKLKN